MTERGLVRGVDLRGAVAVNIIGMVGVGPLITVPLVLGALHGPLSLAGWLLGALLALCDGLVWSELGALYPGSGGTYGYLLAVFGSTRAGSLLAFMFAWQTIFAAPLNSAVGYIGMANYTGYLFPALSGSPLAIKGLAIAFGTLTLVALFRDIRTIARVGVGLAAVVFLTLVCVVGAAYAHFTPALAGALPSGDSLWNGLRMGLGQGLLISIYDYLGYNQASCIGDEVIRPARTLPLSILIAVGLVAALYLTLQVGILGAIPWAAVVPRPDGSLPPLGQHLASAIVERSFGGTAATVVTILIVVSAFGSMYANLLGYSRIPYAAAVQGQFLRPFAHLHPRQRFPDVALLTIGLLALPACLLPLDEVFNALTTGMVIIQSVAQIVALAVVRARGIRAPYRMWLYPLPALVALAGWSLFFGAPAAKRSPSASRRWRSGPACFCYAPRSAADGHLGCRIRLATIGNSMPAREKHRDRSAIKRRGLSLQGPTHNHKMNVSDKLRIAILDDYQGVALQMADWSPVRDRAEIVVFRDHLFDPDRIVERLRPFDVLCVMRERTPLTRAIIERLPRLRLIASTGMANRSIDLDAARERGITVSHTGYSSHGAIELTWALILAAIRSIPAEVNSMRSGGWQVAVGGDLANRTLGLAGLGRIGTAMARIGQAFGMNVIAWSQNLTAERCAAAGARLVSKDALFGEADIVSLHLMLSERTQGIIGAADFARMKPAAWFVNTSRGPLTDEAALIDVLKNRRIAGAALDVFAIEPLPADHPFRTLDNVVATSHIGFVTRESYETFFGDTVKNVMAWLDAQRVADTATA